jgi:DNA-directed RNA polymerase specialized sigma54-like protein
MITNKQLIEHPLNSSIPHIRISTELKQLMDKAIAELNKDGYLEVTIQSFIRQALRFYANECITKQLGIGFK